MANEGPDAVPDERDYVSRVGAESVRELGSGEEEDEVRWGVEQGEVLRVGLVRGLVVVTSLEDEDREEGYLSPIGAWFCRIGVVSRGRRLAAARKERRHALSSGMFCRVQEVQSQFEKEVPVGIRRD